MAISADTMLQLCQYSDYAKLKAFIGTSYVAYYYPYKHEAVAGLAKAFYELFELKNSVRVGTALLFGNVGKEGLALARANADKVLAIGNCKEIVKHPYVDAGLLIPAKGWEQVDAWIRLIQASKYLYKLYGHRP